MNNGYRGRSRYPDFAVAIHLAELRLDDRPIAAGKYKLTGMSFWTDAPIGPPETPNLREGLLEFAQRKPEDQ